MDCTVYLHPWNDASSPFTFAWSDYLPLLQTCLVSNCVHQIALYFVGTSVLVEGHTIVSKGFWVSPVKMSSFLPSGFSQSLLPSSERMSIHTKVIQNQVEKYKSTKCKNYSKPTWTTSWTTQVSPLLQTTVSWLKEALKIKARFQPSLSSFVFVFVFVVQPSRSSKWYIC